MPTIAWTSLVSRYPRGKASSAWTKTAMPSPPRISPSAKRYSLLDSESAPSMNANPTVAMSGPNLFPGRRAHAMRPVAMNAQTTTR